MVKMDMAKSCKGWEIVEGYDRSEPEGISLSNILYSIDLYYIFCH